jgi:SM-20-related protein
VRDLIMTDGDAAPFAPDIISGTSSLTHQRSTAASNDVFLRCEFIVELASAETDLEAVYKTVATNDHLPKVEWQGWRRELTASARSHELVIVAKLMGEVDVLEDDCLADQVLEALQGLESVHSAKLLSTAANCPDTFAVCRGLFSTDIAGLEALKVPSLGTTAATSLITHGFAIVDGFLPMEAVNDVASLAKASLDARAVDGGTDGIAWRHPEPRDGRTDVATWVDADGSSRPGCDACFRDCLLPAIDALAADVRSLMAGVKGTLEIQLACFREGGRQCRHTDGVACGDPASGDRKVTCILYCNPQWEEAHAGKLRLKLADHDGGGTVDVEPRGGRLLCFLAGAMVHEVLPTHADRYAVTAWLT